MKQQVHGAEAGHTVHQLNAGEGAALELLLLLAVQLLMLGDGVVRIQPPSSKPPTAKLRSPPPPRPEPGDSSSKSVFPSWSPNPEPSQWLSDQIAECFPGREIIFVTSKDLDMEGGRVNHSLLHPLRHGWFLRPSIRLGIFY